MAGIEVAVETKLAGSIVRWPGCCYVGFDRAGMSADPAAVVDQAGKRSAVETNSAE